MSDVALPPAPRPPGPPGPTVPLHRPPGRWEVAIAEFWRGRMVPLDRSRLVAVGVLGLLGGAALVGNRIGLGVSLVGLGVLGTAVPALLRRRAVGDLLTLALAGCAPRDGLRPCGRVGRRPVPARRPRRLGRGAHLRAAPLCRAPRPARGPPRDGARDAGRAQVPRGARRASSGVRPRRAAQPGRHRAARRGLRRALRECRRRLRLAPAAHRPRPAPRSARGRPAGGPRHRRCGAPLAQRRAVAGGPRLHPQGGAARRVAGPGASPSTSSSWPSCSSRSVHSSAATRSSSAPQG